MSQNSTQKEISPELYAIEAALSEHVPAEERDALERAKMLALLESCRVAQESLRPPAPERLAETIIEAGRDEITVSLHRYLTMERFQAAAIGLLVGLIIGAVFNIGMLLLLMNNWPITKTSQPTTEIQGVNQ